MTDAAEAVLNHLNLEQLGDNFYSTTHANEGWRQVFGGQLMAQSLSAATKTVPPEKKLVSFQVIFISPADVSMQIDYDVSTMREGKSFSMRQVVARQNGNACFQANVSFQVVTQGLEFQNRMPSVPPPHECADFHAMVTAYQKHHPTHLGDGDVLKSLPSQPVEMRFANVEGFLEASTDAFDQLVWIKFNARISDDEEHHQQILAYASDQTIAHLVAQPHGLGGINPKLGLVSLDQSMWYHRPFRADDWLLLVRRCTSTTAGRALVTGQIFDQAGNLIASLAQQALMRLAD